MAGKLLPLSNFSQDKSICNSESQVTPRRTSLSLEDMGKKGVRTRVLWTLEEVEQK